MTRRQIRQNASAALVGLAATAAVVLAYLLGGLDWLEWKTLDLRFCYTNSIPEDPRIACIDIDDGSLARVGRWPWPRDQQAGMIAVLSELGARAIVMDIAYTEPETLRWRTPPDVDLVVPADELEQAELQLLQPDRELAAAIRAAGNVYLAYHYDPDAWEQSAEFATALKWARAGRFDAAALATAPLPTGAPPAALSAARARRLTDAARVAVAIEADWQSDCETVARRTGLHREFVQSVFERCRQAVLWEKIAEWRSLHWPQLLPDVPPTAPAQSPTPELPLRDLYEWLTNQPFADETPLRAALAAAYRAWDAHQATLRGFSSHRVQIPPGTPRPAGIAPIYGPHARSASGCGFVAFEPEDDGVMRRTALFAQTADGVHAQLALVCAWDLLQIAGSVVTDGQLTLDVAVGTHVPARPPIQVDSAGRVIVPWVPQRDWTKQFGEHVPADALWTVQDRRAQLEQNRGLLRDTRAALFSGGLLPEAEAYRSTWDACQGYERELRRARYEDPRSLSVGAAEAKRRYGREELEKLEHRILAQVRAAAAATTPPDEDLAFALEQIEATERLADRIAAANDALAREIDETLARLRPRVQDKICLVGYTATSLADMVPLPTHKRAPGVIAHANLLNGLLTGRMVSWAPLWANTWLALLCGLLASALSITISPRWAALLVFALAAFIVWLAAGLFFMRTCWLAITPAVGAAVAAYGSIGIFRYVFLDRERRQLASALSQYTSATLARKMADDPELCRRAETRAVTAIFTDLRGFTTISERIGAERTQRVLNICLGACSEVLLRHEAMINKFMGDGIFAFWNPVIYAQPDHARRACAAALELQDAVRALARGTRGVHETRGPPAPGRAPVRRGDHVASETPLAGLGLPRGSALAGQIGDGDDALAELEMRIGIASGPAVVGPCGSEQKFDYTCIGDTVNLASRLEAANKFYGTHILVSAGTRAAAGEGFVFRPLGGVQVKGKTTAVPIFELLGRVGAVDPATLAYVDDFARVVALFQSGDWTAATAACAACADCRPDDLAAVRYLEALRQHAGAAPPAGWTGALELTEK